AQTAEDQWAGELGSHLGERSLGSTTSILPGRGEKIGSSSRQGCRQARPFSYNLKLTLSSRAISSLLERSNSAIILACTLAASSNFPTSAKAIGKHSITSRSKFFRVCSSFLTSARARRP